MATIELKQVAKMFGEQYAVKPVDLTIGDGEFVALLGPSGCGKTTTLRMLSGLEAVTSGQILLNGKNITWLKPADRNMAFVFQFYALYPHLTVRENILFPLRAEGMAREEQERRLASVVEVLRISHLLGLRPGKLSGGDKQRAALARALVRSPAAFLMDEPLGALDAEFRESMRAEIKSIHLNTKATTVYVTHDQVEAMAMADRIVVMSAAEVQQVGTPAEVYHNPANLFVAGFIGSPGMNRIQGTLVDGNIRFPGMENRIALNGKAATLAAGLKSENVIVGFRPEAARLNPEGSLVGTVYASDMYGAYRLLHVNINEGEIIHIRTDRSANFPIDTPVRFDLRPDMARFFDPNTGRSVAVA